MANTIPRLSNESTSVLVIDLQDKLLPAICEADLILAAAGKLIAAAKLLSVPMLATEQYPAGLGKTNSEIAALPEGQQCVEKLKFSACVEEVVDQLTKLDRPHVLVVGIEAHVCVQQSVLDLIRLGYLPFVCADAVSSRRQLDRNIAIERMRDAGAIITTVESAIFEMVGKAGTETFKQILRIVK